MTDANHYEEEIQDLLDNRLDAATSRQVEAHLVVCDRCRRVREGLRRVRETLRTGLSPEELPAGVSESICASLDREDERIAGRRGRDPRRPRPGRLFAYAAAAAAVIALAVFFARPRDLPSAVAGDYARLRAGSLALEIETSDEGELERYFADRGVRFPTRVLDLRMMGYRLAGGRVLGGDGGRRAFFVYRGEGNKILACQMYEGDVRDLPGAPEVRRHGDFTFLVYRMRDQTQVFWQEGTVACVLVSDMPSEEVVALAFAKAMKA